MTDRAAAFIVTLDQDYRMGDYVSDDDGALIPIGAEAVAHALRMVKGVASVEPVVADHALHVAEKRARLDLEQRVLAALRPEAGRHGAGVDR